MTRLLRAASTAAFLVGLLALIPFGFLILVSAWLEDAATEREQDAHSLALDPEHR
jgi:hypothetical protein